MIQLRAPYGEWKFEGFATSSKEDAQGNLLNSNQSYSLSKYNSDNSRNPLLLTLTKEKTFAGNTPSDEISGEFTFDPSRGTFSFIIYPDDSVEKDNGPSYLACLQSVTSYAVLATSNLEQKLHLYYTKDKTRFLLFSAAN